MSDGETYKQLGMFQADAFADEDWKARTDREIQRKAALGEPFTAEDIRAVVGDPPSHPNAMGTRFHLAARRGFIRKVDYRNAERPSLHSHPIAVWIGTAAARKKAAVS